MANSLRVVYDNAADRATTTVSASTGTYVASNLNKDIKYLVWRTPQVSNLFTNNSADSNNGWTLGSNTTRVGNTTAPDGSNNAVVYTATTVGSNNTYLGQVVAIPAVSFCTISIWARLVTGTFPTSGSLCTIGYDVDGVAGTTEQLFIPFTGLNNSWQKFKLTFFNVSANSFPQYFAVNPLTNAQIALFDAELTITPIGSISSTWVSPELINSVALPFCNLSPTATARVRVTNEQPATNLLIQSANFGDVSWTKSNTTITANSGKSPGGGMGSYKLAETTSNSLHSIYYIRTGSNETLTFSIFLKAQERTKAAIRFSNISTATLGAVLDLSAGTVTSVDATNSDYTLTLAPAPLSFGNGWYRFSISTKKGVVNTTNAVQIDLVNASGALSYTGDGTSGILIWSAQLEVGNVMTSYYGTSGAAATRPVGYIDAFQSYNYDNTTLVCPSQLTSLRGFTTSAAQSAYAYGGGNYAVVWLSNAISAYGVKIDITDADNSQGYIEASRLVIGNYWSPTYNAAYGNSQYIVVDSSKNVRTDGGDLITDNGTRSKKLTLNLSNMPAADRTTFTNIIRGSGMSYPMFISVSPSDADADKEKDFQIYGKLSTMSAIVLSDYNIYNSTIEIEEV